MQACFYTTVYISATRIRRWRLELSQISLCRVSVLNDTDQILLTGKMFSVYPLNHMVYLAYNSEGHIKSGHTVMRNNIEFATQYWLCTRGRFLSPKPSSSLCLVQLPHCRSCLHVYVSPDHVLCSSDSFPPSTKWLFRSFPVSKPCDPYSHEMTSFLTQ